MRLRKARQEVVKLEATVAGVPFSLPKLQMVVEEAPNSMKEITCILPNTFNKYLSTRSDKSALQANDTVSFRTEPFTLSQVHNLQSKLSHFLLKGPKKIVEEQGMHV